MKKQFLFFVIALFGGSLLHAQQQTVATRIIVAFKPDAPVSAPWENDAQLLQLFKEHTYSRIETCGSRKNADHRFYVFTWNSPVNTAELINTFTQSPLVKYAEADGQGAAAGVQLLTPNDQYFYNRQWALKNDGTFSLSTATAGADIDMENAWAIEQGDSTIVLGVIDTGTKLDHPEFSGRLWINSGEIAGNNIDDDSNGFVDDINGWDFANNDNSPVDDHGHGTNVAGIACATGNNSIGYAGVDWHCKLMTMKGLDASSYGFYSWWADALYYAADNGVNVLNMSLGGSGTSATLQNAINYALSHNVTIAVSMMNFNDNGAYIPASFSGVIAVGSTDSDDARTAPFFWSTTSGSCYGSHISVVAPGNYIYGLSNSSNTNYGSYWGGTSQAAPHVAGLSTLLLAQNPTLTPAQIKSLIEATAEDQVGDPAEDVAGWDQYHGHGRINANYALSVMTGFTATANTANAFSVYPNPVQIEAGQGTFTIAVPANTSAVEVYDATGRLMQTHALNGTDRVQVAADAPGIYMIRMLNAGHAETKKVIVTR